MEISIICTDPMHPIVCHLKNWMHENSKIHHVRLVNKSSDLTQGDILFLISCHEIINKDILAKFKFPLVLHASDLPNGRGMSPHIWQILEGHDNIKLSLLNADQKLDAGDIWLKINLEFNGSELYDEINEKIFAAELSAMTWAVNNINTATPTAQIGSSSYYRKRTPEDSRIDPHKTIAEQFNLLRVCDPIRYPAFFEMGGIRYKISIEKMEEK